MKVKTRQGKIILSYLKTEHNVYRTAKATEHRKLINIKCRMENIHHYIVNVRDILYRLVY